MEKSITLINPGTRERMSNPYPPLWMAYLQAVLKKNGASVEVQDLAVQSLGPIRTEWAGISATTPQAEHAYSLADKIDQKKVIGGPHPTIFPDECLKHFDKVVVGEGEKSILQIFDSKEKILKSELINNLDELPYPDWSGLDIKNYRSPTKKHSSLPIMTSRGCPWNCVYCYKGIYGRLWRSRSAENVIGEMEYLQSTYGIQEVSILDDMFTTDPKRVEKICSLIIEKKLDISWTCPNGIRVDSINKGLLQLMKKAGCYQLAFGIESGNQEVLNKIRKQIDLEQARKAIEWCRELGIETISFFMIGLPYDSPKTMQDTIDFAKSLKTDFVQFTNTVPYPGTELFDLVQEHGRFLITDWEKYGSYTGRAYYELYDLKGQDVEEYYKKANRAIYSRPGYVLSKVVRNPRLLIEGIKRFRKRM